MSRDFVSSLIRNTKARSGALLGFLVFLSVSVLPVCAEGQVKPIRRVLILYELGLSSPSVSVLDEKITKVLQESPFQIELYREYLETTLFASTEDQNEIRDSYIHKYRDRKPDVVITLGPSPLRFLAESHEKAFRGVPVVFGGLSGAYLNLNLGADFTGIWDRVEPVETLEVALRLKPTTKHVVVVGGTGAFDKELERWFHERLRSYESKLEFTYLTDLPMPQLLEQLKRLPANTIVLLAHIGLDSAGNRFVGASQADPMVVNAANAPVFGPSDVDLGHGEVGGYLDSFAFQGKVIGEIATRILEGEKPQNISIVRGTNAYMFDWRALKRWGMKERDLPAGSIVLNRAPGFWEQYGLYVFGAILVLFAQAAVIVTLIWQQARIRKAEIKLIRSEEKFSRAFRQSPLAITIVRASDGRYIDVNETFELQTGWKVDEVIGKTPLDLNLWVDPGQRTAFLDQLSTTGNVRNLEVRYRRRNGQVRTSLGSAELIELNGEKCALSVIADVTERKAAEDALSTVSRRLIEAQDAERTRIARELHDDINQRLALLRVSLSSLIQELPAAEVQAGRQIEDACAEIAGLGNDIQELSHRLHSSRLEYLGLDAACAGLCKEVSERQKIGISVNCQGIPKDLSSDVSFCLFRVLQEALQNAVKHSRAPNIEVAFTSSLHEIKLMVRDFGVGFDPAITAIGPGLGLISMRERLKLVEGQLSIDSKPKFGTTILAQVPLRSRMDSSGAVA